MRGWVNTVRWLALGAGAWIASTSLAQTLTVDEAVRIASENAFGVRIAKNSWFKAQDQADQARASLGPTLGVQGTYQRFLKDQFSSFGGGKENKAMSVTLTLPVDLVRVNARVIEAARDQVESSRQLVEVELNTLRSRVRTAYYQVVLATWLVRVNSDALANTKQALDVAMKRFEAGELARYDTLRFESDVQRAEAAFIAAKNQLRLSKHVLNNTMGRAIDVEFSTQEIEKLPEIALDAAALSEAAIKNRPELKSNASRQKALAKVREAEARGLLPSFQLSANYQRSFNSGSPFSQQDQTTGTAVVNIPLLDSGVTRAKVNAARRDEELNRLQYDQIALGIRLEVRQALVRFENAVQQLAVATKSVELARETYRVARLKYDNTQAIQLEVSSAQTQMTQAETDFASARYEALIAYAELQRAVGADDIAVAAASATREEAK